MKKLPYREGTWFAVPLEDNKGYAVGLVARTAPRGPVILAYFFGPKRFDIPSLSEVSKFKLEDSIKCLMVGDLGLLKGAWTVIGELVPWDRKLWPMPQFIRRGRLTKTSYRIIYSDENPNKIVREEPIPYDTQGLEKDGMAGYGYAEAILTDLLDAQELHG